MNWWLIYTHKSAVSLCWSNQEFVVLQPQVVFSAMWLAVGKFSLEINEAQGIGQMSPDPLLLLGKVEIMGINVVVVLPPSFL